MKLINAHRTGEQCIICIENSDGKRINAEISRTDYNQLITGLSNVPSIFDECYAPVSSPLQEGAKDAKEFLKDKGISVDEEIDTKASASRIDIPPYKLVDLLTEFRSSNPQLREAVKELKNASNELLRHFIVDVNERDARFDKSKLEFDKCVPAGSKQLFELVANMEGALTVVERALSAPNETNLEELFKQHQEYAKKQFTNSTAESSLIGLKREVNETIDELKLKDYDGNALPLEYVDCMMYLIDSLQRSNIDWEQFKNYFKMKLSINKGRKWKQNKDGSYSHVK